MKCILSVRRYTNTLESDKHNACSQGMQDYLLNSFKLLSDNEQTRSPGLVDINALWRFFTANMWSKTISI